MSEIKFFQKESVLISALMIICLILFFFNLGDRALWDIDEGMHAATSKDMVLSGDWLTPQYNGEKFYDKPPLHNWLVAISFMIFGFTEFAARLPAALLGLGCVMVTYLMGRQIFGPRAAFLSAVVLATSAEYFVLSRVVVHDISLAFFMTVALALFYLGYNSEKHRRSLFLLGYAAMGFSVLAKGPVGVFFHDILKGSSRGLDKGIFYSYLPLAIILPLALIYIILFPPVNLKADAGIELKWIYYLAAWLVACCFISMGLAVRKKYRLFIGSIVGTVITVLLFSLIFLVPPIEPFRSGKILAQKIDKLIEPSEDLVFYLKARDTFLFYTNRMAAVLKNPRELRDYMASDKRVYCIFKMDDWQDVEMLHKAMHIVALEGNKLIVSNIKPD
jgi:hypothetical protein